MVIITILSAIPMLLYNIARNMMLTPSNDGDNDGGNAGAIAVFIAIFVIYYVTELLVLYGSRIREYYADKGSVRLGNEPHHLAAALFKLTPLDNRAKGTADLERIESAKAFLFNDPSPSKYAMAKLAHVELGTKETIDADGLMQLRQKKVKLGFRDTVKEVFSTHPDVLKRMKALSEL
jgi:heat shock protein HtpX